MVYKLGCSNCSSVYIGETGRKLAIWMKEFKAEVQELPTRSQTRSSIKDSNTIRHKSAICDHAHQENHVIDGGGHRHWAERVIGYRGKSKKALPSDSTEISWTEMRVHTNYPKAWDCVIPIIRLGGGAIRSDSSLAATYHQVAAVLRKMATMQSKTSTVSLNFGRVRRNRIELIKISQNRMQESLDF